jgi:signal transduction histidine kinase
VKLIRHTISRISLLLIPFFVLGIVLTYQIFSFIAYKEIDEFLNHEKNRILSWYQIHNNVPDAYSIVRVYPVEKSFTPFFADTLLLETGDMEMVPYRELHFSLTYQEEHLGVVLRHLLLGREDFLKAAAMLMGAVSALMVLLIFVGIRLVTSSVWRPFFYTIGKIQTFRSDQPPEVLPPQQIYEFNLLNDAVNQMKQKMWRDFSRTKSFNDNAAHELQTKLALIKTMSEQLPDYLESNEEGLQTVQKIHVNTTRLSYMLRSLLLLSKIGNGEYPEKNPVAIDKIAAQTVDFFSEAMQMRGLRVKVNLQPTILEMDTGLANILITNLVKNAVVHNIHQGSIDITLDSRLLQIENTGLELEGPASDYLDRFRKGASGNMGLGLNIASEICRLYNFELEYHANENLHRVAVQFQ